MLDTSSILAQDNTGLCNAAITSGKDDSLGKLRLRQPIANGTGWHHDILVTEDSEVATKENIGLLGG
jgi:hypothetical protein